MRHKAAWPVFLFLILLGWLQRIGERGVKISYSANVPHLFHRLSVRPSFCLSFLLHVVVVAAILYIKIGLCDACQKQCDACCTFYSSTTIELKQHQGEKLIAKGRMDGRLIEYIGRVTTYDNICVQRIFFLLIFITSF